MANRHEEYVSIARQKAIQLWEAYQDLLSMQDEWAAQDYGNTLTIDPGGNNADILPADVGAVVFATADAIKVVMDAGHATNVTTLLE
jgi:hypothetical protein